MLVDLGGVREFFIYEFCELGVFVDFMSCLL